jgi:hypothetical protein
MSNRNALPAPCLRFTLVNTGTIVLLKANDSRTPVWYKPFGCNDKASTTLNKSIGLLMGNEGARMPPAKPKNGNGKDKAQNGGNLGFEAELLRRLARVTQ